MLFGRLGREKTGYGFFYPRPFPPTPFLLDVDMPVLDGPAMAHNMLVHDAGEEEIPIVLFSAKSDLPAIAAKMGTPYWLAKPFGLEGLRAVLDRAIREHFAPAHP